jgi:hypothetical protein
VAGGMASAVGFTKPLVGGGNSVPRGRRRRWWSLWRSTNCEKSDLLAFFQYGNTFWDLGIGLLLVLIGKGVTIAYTHSSDLTPIQARWHCPAPRSRENFSYSSSRTPE